VGVTLANPGFLAVTKPNAYTYDAVGPLLLTDTILAFGDSITAGVTRTFCGMFLCDATTTPYPQRLELLLRAAYPSQSVLVQGSGSPGECVSADGCTGVAGRDRLPLVMTANHDLVVLLEGVNDTNAGPTDGAIVNALRTMIQTARTAGKSVILCGLLPVKPREDNGMLPASPARIASVNAALAQMASDEGVPFVNMVAAFGPVYEPLLSPDGIHPNGPGYQRMAEAIRDAVVSFFAIP
jgi:lysophospholipase L1-like esterase